MAAPTCRLFMAYALPELGVDVSELFKLLIGLLSPGRLPAVSSRAEQPWPTHVLGHDRARGHRTRAGKPARIFAKMNSLVDRPIIRALYASILAGVQIEPGGARRLLLAPTGLPGISNIRVHSA